MIIRPAASRGYLNAKWIFSYRTFSNNSYWDPKYQNWKSLKVINDDTQQPHNIIPNHRHEAYDILGYIIEGELEHVDDLGNKVIAKAGQIQHMWCGTGIHHTEANISDVPCRYLQIWITSKPEYRHIHPYYELINKSPEFGDIGINLKQDIKIKAGILKGHYILNTSSAYIYVIDGIIRGKDFNLYKGDGSELFENIEADFDCHIILFEQN
jgi:redox-sensitive bicupin YhaK (pirin superfamily)